MPSVMVYYRFFGRFHVILAYVNRSVSRFDMVDDTRVIREPDTADLNGTGMALNDLVLNTMEAYKAETRQTYVELVASRERKLLEGLFSEDRPALDLSALCCQRPFDGGVNMDVTGRSFDCSIHLECIETSFGRLKIIVQAMKHVCLKAILRREWLPTYNLRAPHQVNIRSLTASDVAKEVGRTISSGEKQRCNWHMITILFPNHLTIIEAQKEKERQIKAKSEALSKQGQKEIIKVTAPRYVFTPRSKFCVVINFTDAHPTNGNVPPNHFALSYTCFLPTNRFRKKTTIAREHKEAS